MAVAKCYIKTDQKGRELAEHGSTLFPAACYNDNMAEELVAWHWHNELEFITVTEGAVVVAAGTEKYVVKQGNGFFINAGVLHAVWSVDEYGKYGEPEHCCGDVDYINLNREKGTVSGRLRSIVFHPRLVGGSIDSIFWHNYVQPLLANNFLKCAWLDRNEPWQKEAIRYIEDAWKYEAEELPGYEIRVRNALSELLFLLNTHRPAIQNRPSDKAIRDGERIKVMLQYIQENYESELSIEQIAQSVMISESECLRCFRSTIGTTPIQYVKQFRIQKAAELLGDTQMKISDIGARCGFQEMSYFAKTFRELRGCTPSEYRKERR